MNRVRVSAVVAALCASSVVHAQPAPDSRVDAKALMQSGVRLLEAKDYLGALAVFKDAYARFQSAKILLNIGTTLNLLDRKAEAGNTYQRYLDSSDTDPAKRADVTAALVEIDKAVGRLEITVTPADAEVQVTDSEWMPTTQAKLYRVSPGAFTVRARKDKFGTEAKSAQISAGERTAIAIALTATPEVVATAPVLGTTGELDGFPTTPREPRSRIGLVALAHIDVTHSGIGVLVGPTFDITDRLEVQLTAILGPTYGAYAGGSFTLVGDTTRAFVAAGVPLFFSDGARVGVRGAAGVDFRIAAQFSVIAELGGELMLNPEDDILQVAFIPSVGVSARM